MSDETQMTSLEDPYTVLQQIQDVMQQCTQLLEEGKRTDLSDLDEKVKTLCQGIALLSYEEADRMRPKLETVVRELETLGNALEQQKNLLGEQLGELNNQKQAHNAYQRASASGAETAPEIPKNEE